MRQQVGRNAAAGVAHAQTHPLTLVRNAVGNHAVLRVAIGIDRQVDEHLQQHFRIAPERNTVSAVAFQPIVLFFQHGTAYICRTGQQLRRVNDAHLNIG